MKNTLILFIIFFATVSSMSQSGGDIKLSFKKEESKHRSASVNLNNIKAFSTQDKLFLKNELLSVPMKQESKRINQTSSPKKSPVLGGLFSLLLPGAGEFYAKSYLKVAIFFGIEAAAWTFYAIYRGKGNSQTESFQAYADQYWSVSTYAQWLVDQGFKGSGGINPNEQNLNVLFEQIRACESQNFSHTIPDYQSQQYYELIGKYQNFQAGWTNLSHVPTKAPGPYNYETYRDPVFTYYAVERQKANDYYNTGQIGIYAVILNHLLSAADAVWSVNAFNKNLKVQTGMNMRQEVSPYTYKVGLVPTMNVRVSF